MSYSRENVAGLSVHYRRHVLPGAPTLLLTNAWPMSIRCWDLHWEKLAASFSVLAYDLPGFGLSEGRPALMNPAAQATFAGQLLDHFGLSQVHAIGPDVGVPMLLFMAATQPARLKSLIVFNGPGSHPPVVSFEIAALVRSRLARATVSVMGPLFAAEARRRGYKRHQPSREALAEYQRVNAWGGNFPLTLAYLASYSEQLPRIDALLADIRCPVLILWGDQDSFIKLANAPILQRKIPTSVLEVLKGAGHFAHEDVGDAFAERVLRWVRPDHP